MRSRLIAALVILALPARAEPVRVTVEDGAGVRRGLERLAAVDGPAGGVLP